MNIDPRTLALVSSADAAKEGLLAIGCRLDPGHDRLWIVPVGKMRAARRIARSNNYPAAFTAGDQVRARVKPAPETPADSDPG